MNSQAALRLPSVIAPVLRAGAAALVLLSLAGTKAGAAEEDAKAILKAMTDYLSAQQTVSFTFDSDIEVITPQMEKIQFTNSGEALLIRPDKLRAHRMGGYSDVDWCSTARRSASMTGAAIAMRRSRRPAPWTSSSERSGQVMGSPFPAPISC